MDGTNRHLPWLHLAVYRMPLRGLCLTDQNAPVEGPVRAFRYHRPIGADAVQRIEVRQKGAGFQLAPVPDGDIPSIVAWFNAGSFQGDNDDLSGPGCRAKDLAIYLRSGEQISISLERGMMHVALGKTYYFLKQDQLEQYIHDARAAGSGC